MDREPKAAGSPPDAASLQEAALAYLARYAATQASLLRVLDRRIERWARRVEGTSDPDATAHSVAAAKQAARVVVLRLAGTGVVNDAAFAESRARSLARAGRSRRAIGAHLAAKGVGAETQRSILTGDPEAELAAALVLARRRQIGPFRPGELPDLAGRRRELAILARAGFPQGVARRALEMDPFEADATVNQFRR